jgi:hypothetical protein
MKNINIKYKNKKLTTFLLILLTLFSFNNINAEELQYDLPPQYTTLQNNMDLLTFEADEDKLNESFKIVEDLLLKDSSDPIALMYKGSLSTIKARDSKNFVMKKTYLDEGLALMDTINVQAHRENPNIYLRLLAVRGFTNSKAPAFMNRAKDAVADLKMVEKSVFFNKFKPEDKVKIYMALYFCYRTLNSQAESIHYKTKAIDIDPALANRLLNQ